jgi:hypothetical protein
MGLGVTGTGVMAGLALRIRVGDGCLPDWLARRTVGFLPSVKRPDLENGRHVPSGRLLLRPVISGQSADPNVAKADRVTVILEQ